MTVYAFTCDQCQWWYSHEPGNKVRLLSIAEQERAEVAREKGQLKVVVLDWLGAGAVRKVAA